MFKLNFEKLDQYDLYDEVCHVSLPFKQGSLKNKNQISMYDSKNKPLTLQSRVLSKWEDDSIKWLSVYFRTDLLGNRKNEVYVQLMESDSLDLGASKYVEVANVSECQEVGDSGVCISWPLEALLAVSRDTTRSTMQGEDMDHKKLKSSRPSLYHLNQFIRLADGTTFRGRRDDEASIQIFEGPVCSKWLIKGSHYNELEQTLLPFELTISQENNKPWIRLDYRIINNLQVDIRLKEVEVEVSGTFGMPTHKALGTSNYRTSILYGLDQDNLAFTIDGAHLLKEANEHYPETFYGTFFGDLSDESSREGICVTQYQAYQNFPKSLVVEDERILIKLLPEMEEALVLRAGMAKTHTYFLHLHDETDWQEAASYEDLVQTLNLRSLRFQMPNIPVPDSKVYRESGVFEAIYVDEGDYEFDQKHLDSADRRSRGFGLLHWGDAPDMGYTNQGRGNGRLVWTNNEYDFPHAATLLYTKTGVRRILDYSLVAARHQMDVDVCHAPGLGLRYKGQIEHSADHIEGEVKPCHQWVEGLLDYYHLTGDEGALHIAIGMGDNIIELLKQPKYEKSGGISARETGWAMRSLLGLYRETYDDKWLKPTYKIIDQFKAWYDAYGGWLAPYTDHTVIRVPFMIAVAVGSLMRYYKIRPDSMVRSLIIEAVDDLVENCMLPSGYFFYKELPSLQRPSYNCLVLEALAYAYELTGDIKYLKAGLKTFEAGGPKGSDSDQKKLVDAYTLVTAGPGPKTFAQSYHALALFRKHMLEAGI